MHNDKPCDLTEKVSDASLHERTSRSKIKLHQLSNDVLFHQQFPGLRSEGESSEHCDAVLCGGRGTTKATVRLLLLEGGGGSWVGVEREAGDICNLKGERERERPLIHTAIHMQVRNTLYTQVSADY